MNAILAPSPQFITIVDRNECSRAQYQSLIDGLGFEMQFLSSSQDVVDFQHSDQVQCAVVDIGIECDESVLRNFLLPFHEYRTPVILSATDRRTEQAITGLELGAVALLQRPFPVSRLEDATKLAMKVARIRNALRNRFSRLRGEFDRLTERQRLVLDEAVLGQPNKAIANRLRFSQRTIEGERTKIVAALRVESFSEAILKYGAFAVLDDHQQLLDYESQLRLQHRDAKSQEPLGDAVTRLDALHSRDTRALQKNHTDKTSSTFSCPSSECEN